MKMIGQIGVNIIGLLCLSAVANLISGCSVGETIKFVTRAGWSARSPKRTTPLSNNLESVVVYQAPGQLCNDTETCGSRVRAIQLINMGIGGRNNIGYNFLIGGDNKVYDGTGWDLKSEHFEGSRSGYNEITISVGFIGNYQNTPPPDGMVDALVKLLRVGRAFRHLASNSDLCTYRQYIEDIKAEDFALYDTINGIPGYTC